MFSDKNFASVGFESQVTKEKLEKKAKNIQTETIIYKSKEAQVVETKCIQTQTSQPAKKSNDVNYDSLAQFLKKVTPGVISMLDETYGTSAFDNYLIGSDDSEPVTTIQLINRINTLESTEFKGKISDLTWSNAGGTLAVSHSVNQHETWCNDLTKISLYAISKDNLLMPTPSKTLEVSSCVTSVLYHPDEPSIIAAGLFNGDVLVWNLRDDLSVTPLQLCTHGDSVSQIQWNSRILKNASALVSASNDGYIYIHKLALNFTQSFLHKKYKIRRERNPSEKTRPQSAGGKRERAEEAGLSITSFEFSLKDQSLIIVGTLCGGLYKCKLDNLFPIEGDENTFDPVIDEYERHRGSVTSIKRSPTKNVFVTSGTDREIRIYDFDQMPTQHVISVDSTIVRLSWYFGHSDIFLAYGAGCDVKFFNVRTGRALPQIMLHSENRGNTCCLSFNPKKEMVAIGNSSGLLEIWRFPSSLRPN